MDLGNLSEYGVSKSSTRWATNPVRRAVWWLISPFFRGAEARIEARINAAESGIRGSALAIASDAGSEAEKRVTAQIDSRLGGLRKDASAVAHRMAGLEEEAASFAARIAQLSLQIDSLAQVTHSRLSKLEKLGATLSSGQAEGGLVLAPTQTGDRLLVRRQDHIGKRIIAGEEWEPHVRKAIEAAAKPNGIAIDAGAYIGIHTMTMSRCFSAVHAFEPQRGIYQVLCGNLALNDRLNVTTHNTALYDRSIAMRLATQDHQEVDVPMVSGEVDYKAIGNAAALSFEIANPGEAAVDAIALDDLALDNVSLIKVDTQGSDLRVLQGAVRTIVRSKPIVLFEWERDLGAFHGASLDDFLDFFNKINYDVEILHDTSPGRQADYIAKPRDGVRQ